VKVLVLKSFEKDIVKIKEAKLASSLGRVIEALEACDSLTVIPHIKKMQAKGNYYRVRVGTYRLGFKLEKDTIILLRFLHRKEIYSYFP